MCTTYVLVCESIKNYFPPTRSSQTLSQCQLWPVHHYTVPCAGLNTGSFTLLDISQYKLALVATHPIIPSVTVMIPEAGMTLDSILEGILSERESEEDEADQGLHYGE